MNFRPCRVCVSITVPYRQSDSKDAIYGEITPDC